MLKDGLLAKWAKKIFTWLALCRSVPSAAVAQKSNMLQRSKHRCSAVHCRPCQSTEVPYTPYIKR